MPRYASLIYNGYWWSPERLMVQEMIDASQKSVNGVVRLKLYKGNVSVVGRKSDESLFDATIATFEDDAGAYNQADAAGIHCSTRPAYANRRTQKAASFKFALLPAGVRTWDRRKRDAVKRRPVPATGWGGPCPARLPGVPIRAMSVIPG